MLILNNKYFLSILFIFGFFVKPIHADVTLNIDKDSAFIFITGEINDGDSNRFNHLIEGVKNSVRNGYVVLDSPGGKVNEAITIGMQLRKSGFSTAVLDNSDCQSACALIWLAGNKRFATSTSRIGFHQSYIISHTGKAIPSIQGNALVGYYLAKIDANASVVAYVTSASPETFEWLSFSKAEELGIDVLALNDVEQTTMGRVENKPQIQKEGSLPKPIARLPSQNSDAIPSYKNIRRAVKNTIDKYKKDGIIGLSNSSLACWDRVSELRTAKSFQYCFSLDMVSGYIDSLISDSKGSKRYEFFTNSNLLKRLKYAQNIVKDQVNIPSDFISKWGEIAVNETNRVAASK